jgi:GxxExxY protein
MIDILHKEESYTIIGICMEVHDQLGPGFSEIVYKDALEYEFKNRGIEYEREKNYKVAYKETVLSHDFYADFVVYNKIILEVKSASKISDEFIAKAMNYCRVSNCSLALIVNFGEPSLISKRVLVDELHREWLKRRKFGQ